MSKFRSWLRRQTKRMKVRFRKWNRNHKVFKAPEIVNGYENISCAIVRKMISHPDSKFTIAPLSEKRYIVNKTVDIFVIIEDGKVEITNHIYHYDVKFSNRDWERITYVFDNETEKRRIDYEDIINSQIKNSLHNVLDRISKL
jgi:ferric iron reductase protein FhuF